MSLVIDRAHCGPPESGNGGWVAGQLAARLVPGPRPDPGAAITVRLSNPPPLDRPLEITVTRDIAELTDGEDVIAVARLVHEEAPALVVPASAAEGAAAEARYEGLEVHPFPTCFSCGTARSPEDALCLRPGPVDDGSGRYAACWTPREASVPLVWAALDCPGGWAAGVAGRPMVLGSMTLWLQALPDVGVEQVVTAWQVRAEGRKHFSASMLHSPDGTLGAVATAIWIAVDPASIRPRNDAREGAS